MFLGQASAHHRLQQHQQQHQQHQQQHRQHPQQHQQQQQQQQRYHQQHQHRQHQQHQHQYQHHLGKAYGREEVEDLDGRRDYFCYLGDLGKSAQHALKQGGVERALEFGEATAVGAAVSDLGGVRDEWLSAVDDSMAMLFDDATATTATIRLELVGTAFPAPPPSSSLSLSSPPSSSPSSSSLLASPSSLLPSPSWSSPMAAAATPATTAMASASTAAAAAAVEVATSPDQTREFFLPSITGHGGDPAADWLADMSGGGSQGGAVGGAVGIGVGVGGGIGFGAGYAGAPSCMPVGGEEMLLPPEARPPWEKATTVRSRLVTCESVLPLPKPQQQQQQTPKMAFAPRQRAPKSDPANSRQSSTGRPRRGSVLPR